MKPDPNPSNPPALSPGLPHGAGNPLRVREAILVMDSRTAQAAVRNQGFSGTWSQLYVADHFYLDLSLKPDGGQALLLGKLVSPGKALGGSVHLHGETGGEVAQADLGEGGSFRLRVDKPGSYQLEMRTPDDRVILRSVELA